MSQGLLAVLMTLSIGQYPGAYCPPSYGGGDYGDAYSGAYGGGSGGGANDPFFPYDAQQPWVHGYFQEIPSYGGFHFFRPYNYRHVMPQAQVAGGWGMPPTMPYSQDFFNRAQYQSGYPTGQGRQPYRNSSYESELSRLRAQYDFERQTAPRRTEMLPPPSDYGTPSHGSGAYGLANGYGSNPAYGSAVSQGPAIVLPPASSGGPIMRGSFNEPYSGSGVDPASYNRGGRIEEMHRQIELQAQQLQLMQQALQEETARSAPPADPRYRR